MEQEKDKSQKAAYQLIVPNAVQKDLRRLPPQLQEELLDQHFPSIQAYPHKSPFLKGEFRRLRKYVLSFQSTEYRVTYRVLEETKTVVLIMIGSRESYYERLRQRTR